MFRVTLLTGTALLLAACGDTPIQPTATSAMMLPDPAFDVANSGNPNAAFLLRLDGACGVFLDNARSDISNFDGKYYLTTTKSGVPNLNCTGATLKPEQIPQESYVFRWDFNGLSCTNRILKSGNAHSNCHGTS